MRSLEKLRVIDECNSNSLDQDGNTISLTRNEAIVYSALCKTDKPIKAYELLDLLSENGIKAPMTVYRALEGLQTKGLAQKVFAQNAFMCVCALEASKFRAVITCRRCGDAKLVPLGRSAIQNIFGTDGLTLDNVIVEAMGNCEEASCASR